MGYNARNDQIRDNVTSPLASRTATQRLGAARLIRAFSSSSAVDVLVFWPWQLECRLRWYGQAQAWDCDPSPAASRYAYGRSTIL
jgi:hypothetical protein